MKSEDIQVTTGSHLVLDLLFSMSPQVISELLSSSFLCTQVLVCPNYMPKLIPYNVCVCVCSAAQSFPALCNSMVYNLPVSSIHGIFQAGILEWVISYCRESSQFRDLTCVSYIFCIGRQILYHSATREALTVNHI